MTNALRYTVVDINTTGMPASDGHRVIELAAVEMRSGEHNGRVLHRYYNPDRAVDPIAFANHGISCDMLKNAPRFESEAEAFVDFIKGKTLVFYNAALRREYVDLELRRAGLGPLATHAEIIDITEIAKLALPGRKLTLGAMEKMFGSSSLVDQPVITTPPLVRRALIAGRALDSLVHHMRHANDHRQQCAGMAPEFIERAIANTGTL